MTDTEKLVREVLDITAPTAAPPSNLRGILYLGSILAERGWYKRAEAAIAARQWDEGEHDGCGKDTERAIAAQPTAELVRLADGQRFAKEFATAFATELQAAIDQYLDVQTPDSVRELLWDNKIGILRAIQALAAQQDGARELLAELRRLHEKTGWQSTADLLSRYEQ